MPEAALDKHYRPELRKDQVWSAWQRSDMQSEAEARCMQGGSDATFRFGVTSPDPRHHPGTGCTVNDVRHLAPDKGE